MGAQEMLARYYGLLAEGGFGEAAGMFRPSGDVLWSIPGHSGLAGRYRSRAEIRGALERFHDGSLGTVRRPVHAICVADDNEHVCVQYLLRMVRGEAVCNIDAIDAWHVAGDDLAECWTFLEKPHELDAWIGEAGDRGAGRDGREQARQAP
jgi:hypothetical protein